jgi:hypothetical protein
MLWMRAFLVSSETCDFDVVDMFLQALILIKWSAPLLYPAIVEIKQVRVRLGEADTSE